MERAARVRCYSTLGRFYLINSCLVCNVIVRRATAKVPLHRCADSGRLGVVGGRSQQQVGGMQRGQQPPKTCRGALTSP
jgi:hypothetical protein